MAPDPLEQLGEEFWTWRARQAPRTRDDLPRLERPPGWRPAWAASDVAAYRRQLEVFGARLAALGVGATPVERATDARLLGSAIARVRFELDVSATWRSDPAFYLDQTVGTLFEVLLPPPPVVDDRLEQLAVLLGAVPATLEEGRANLAATLAREPALAARAQVRGAGSSLREAIGLLAAECGGGRAAALVDAADVAAQALDGFADWLAPRSDTAAPLVPVGRRGLAHYLYEVALLPYTPEELLAAGAQEFARAVAFEIFERHRSPDATWPPLPASAAAQSDSERVAELAVRRFYEDRDILSQPADLRHYTNLPRPAYLEPLAWCGVTDDLTGPSRLDEDGTSYVPAPSPDLPYFYRANAADPRAGIVHEGAHYQQLALSWRNPRPLRRHFYDSCPNEGIAFYNEEMLTQAGLFDTAGVSRSIIYSFLRLRALRVEVDLRLALGEWSIAEAADVLAARVPLDRATAEDEATFFAATPAQGLSYLVGKLQLVSLLADSAQREGDTFSLRAFHDWVWRNGNVPFSLLRAEHLGDYSHLERADALARSAGAPQRPA